MQRRAKLVRHVGEEFTLGAVGGLGRLLRPREVPQDRLELRGALPDGGLEPLVVPADDLLGRVELGALLLEETLRFLASSPFALGAPGKGLYVGHGAAMVRSREKRTPLSPGRASRAIAIRSPKCSAQPRMRPSARSANGRDER